MNFAKTTIEDFSIIKNAVDDNIEIIRHDDTGYYNITKIATLVKQLRESQNEPAGYPAGTKKARDWFANQDTQELIESCKSLTMTDCLHYELAAGTPKRFAGTYVHRYLYDHFMSWLDKPYALKVSIILDNMHQAANKKIIQEKEDTIVRLERKIDEEREEARARDKAAVARDAEQTARINQLLGYAERTTEQLIDVENDLVETKEKVEIATDYLKEKSFTSTKNPSNGEFVHYFGATVIKARDGKKTVKLISGQKKYVDTTISTNLKDGHAIVIDPFYNANGIDLRHNAKESFMEYRKDIIETRYANEMKAFGEECDQLKQEIVAHNKIKTNPKRLFRDEKPTKPCKIKIADIPVSFGKSSLTYVENRYISFEEVIQIIKDTNETTQESPLVSDEEE